MALTDFDGMDDTANTQVLMPDGKLVAAGWVNAYPGDFGVVRYLGNGNLDPSFGDGGRVVTAFSDDPELVDAAWGINARPNGGVHVFGETCDADYVVCQFAMAAYLADGSLDESFGDGGLVTTAIPDAATALAWPTRNIMQADGKVVAGGLILYEDNDTDIVLLRYNPDGSLDEDFGDGVISIIDFGENVQFPQDIVALPEDKIMIVGGVADEFDFVFFSEEAFMARINSDGSVDSGFGGGDGYLPWTLDGGPMHFDRALVTSADEIFTIGGNETDCTLQRFDLDGTPDMTFGDNGWVIIDSGQFDLCMDATMTVDGRIALVGSPGTPVESDSRAAIPGRNHNPAAARGPGAAESSPAARQEEDFDHIVGLYHADGTPVTTFGDDGLVRFTINDGAGLYTNIAAQQDGRLLVVGDALVGEQLDISVVRFEGDDPAQSTHPDAFDPTWGWKGVTITDFDGLDNLANTQTLMPDGKLVVGGWVNGYPGDFGLARYLPDGSLDPDFGDDGRVVTAFSDDPERVDAAWAISARPNGGVHLFGETCDANYEVCEFAMAAYLADGSLDESFGEDGLVTTPIADALTAFSWPTRNILQSDGKVVAGGIALYEDGEALTVDLVLIRYNPDGSLDDDFGDGGIGIYDFDGKSHFPQDIAALPGDKIMIVGGVTEEYEGFGYVSQEGFMARINSDGSVDSSFGGGSGILAWNYEEGLFTFDRALVSAENEMFVTGGTFEKSGGDVCTLQRFDLDGNLDMTFGHDGWVTLGGGGIIDVCVDATLTADGQIAFAGYSYPVEDGLRAAAASGQSGKRMLRQAAGPARSSLADNQAESYDNIVALYNADGTPDTTFGPEGLVRFSLTTAPSEMYNLSAQPDGRLLIVGDVLMGEQWDFVVVRLFGGQQTTQVFMPVVLR